MNVFVPRHFFRSPVRASLPAHVLAPHTLPAMHPVSKVLLLALCCGIVLQALSHKDPIRYCDICKGALNEIEWAMSQGMFRRRLAIAPYHVKCLALL